MDVLPTYVQQVFQGFADDAAPATATAISAATNTNFTLRASTKWQLRFRVAQTTLSITTTSPGPTFKLKYQANGTGGFVDVGAQGASGTKVRYQDSSNMTDNDSISTANFRLGAGTGTAVNGRVDENGACLANFGTANGTAQYTEFLFALEWGTTIADGDLIEFSVYSSGDVALNTYTVIPTVRYNGTGESLVATSTIIPAGGGDYISLSAFEAGEQDDFVAADEIRKGECQSGDTVGQVRFSGATTDLTRYWWVAPASGHELGFSITNNTSGPTILEPDDHYRIEGIVIANSSTGNCTGFSTALSNGLTCWIINCVMPDGLRGCSQLSTATLYFVNNIIYGQTNECILQNNASGTVHAYNNTLIGGTYGFRNFAGTGRPKNNIAQGNSTACFSGTMTDSATNLASDATAEIQATLTFVDAANDNYHLAATDTAAIGAGTDLHADATFPFDYDIDVDPRPTGNWDIGADQTAASGVILEPDAAALSAAGFAPTLSAAAAVEPSTAAAVITGLVPIIETSADFTATSDAGALAATGFAPTVAADASFEPASAALAAGTFAPTVAASALLEPGAATLASTGHDPTIETAGNVTVAPTTAALIATGLAPIVAADATAEPPPATLTISGLAPDASAGATAAPGQAMLVLSGLAPAIAADTLLEPSAAVLAASGFAPAFTATALLEPTPGTLAITGQQPDVVTEGQYSGTPVTASLIATGLAPDLSVGTTLEAGQGSVSITGFVPTVFIPVGTVEIGAVEWIVAYESAQVDFTGTPGTASLAVTGFAPTVTTTGDITAEPDAAALVASGLVPSLVAGTTVEPATGQLAATGHAPDVQTAGNISVTPSTAALVATGLEPSVSAAVSITPDSAELTATGQAPTIIAGQGATVEPTAAALVITGHAPDVQAVSGILVTPDTATLAVTGHAPTLETNHFLTADTGAVTVTCFAPSIIAGTGAILTTQTGSLVIVGEAPEFAAHFTAVANAANLIFTGWPPSLAGDQTLMPATASLAITGYPPFIISKPVPSRRTYRVPERESPFGPSDDGRLVPVGANDRQMSVTGRRRVYRVGRRGGSSAA